MDQSNTATTPQVDIVPPRRGRKPINTGNADAVSGMAPEAATAERDAAPAVAEIRANTVAMPREELAQSLHLAKIAGSIAAYQLNETINRVAALKAFAEIRESEAYKGLAVQTVTGDVITVNTWEEFCNAHGYSRKKINEDLQNLAAFGGTLLEMQDALGLGYRDLRLLRKGISQLPQEERRAILEEIRSAEGPEELKSKLMDLRAELVEVKAAKKELEATIQSKERVSEDKSRRLDALEEQVKRLTSIAPDDRQKTRDEVNAKAREDVDRACQGIFAATLTLCSQCVAIFGDERVDSDTTAYVHERVSLTLNNLADAVLGAGINVDLRQSLTLQLDGPYPVTGAAETAETLG